MTTTHTPRIVWVAGLGLFLATLDTGIINVALPSLQTAWHTTPATIAWAMSAYTVVLAATVLVWGRLADRWGPARIFGWGLIGFAVTSSACGAAPTLSALIAARAAQGLASAMIQGTAIALATVDLPAPQRRVATGTLALWQGLGPVIGPTLGGVLLTWTSWRVLFWMNLPVTLALMVLLRRQPAGRTPRNTGERLDLIGNSGVLVTVGLGLLALTTPGTSIRLLCGVGAGLAFVATVGFERAARAPVVSRSLWTVRAFWTSMGAMAVVGGATALGFMVPPYLLHLWGQGAPWQIDLLNVSAPAMLVAFSRPASRLLTRYSATRLMLSGLALMAAAFAAPAATVAARSPLLVVLSLASYGIGAAVFFPANLTGLLELTGPEVYGLMGAVQRMAINLGTAMDAAVVGAFLTHGAPVGHVASWVGIRRSWVYGATTLLLAIGGLRWSYASPKRRGHAS